jgi:4-hydroxy-tetrahydrodipicolinate reductase
MKVAVTGASGRMGKRILALAGAHPDIEIVGALEFEGHPSQGQDAGEGAGLGRLGIPITSDIPQVLDICDVLIDFSAPPASVANVKAAAVKGKAIVVGTTGFTADQRKELLEAGMRTRCLVAPNMSLGVNVLFKITEIVARALGADYDVEIVEAHHRMKKDAPSGTADKLAQIAA